MCIFCNTENINELLLRESEYGIVICNKFPLTPQRHFLVIPKTHYTCLSDIPATVKYDIFTLMDSFIELVKVKIYYDGINVFFNEGDVAGQTVSHFHIHIILRIEGDGISNFKKDNGERNKFGKGEIQYLREALK